MYRVLSIMLGVILICTAFVNASPVTISFGLHTMPGGLDEQAAGKFQQYVSEMSDGQMKVELFPGAVLGGEKELLELIKIGEVDLVIFGDFPVATLTPDLAPMQVPFLFPNYDALFAVYAGPVGEAINKVFAEKADMMLLGVQRRGARNLTANIKITSPDDLQGIKLRLPEIPVWVDTWKATGVLPTPVAWPETYSALQMGVVDAQENPFETILTGKIHEVQKYIMLTEHLLSVYHWAFSNKTYRSLTPEQRNIIREAADKALAWANSEAAAREEEAKGKLVALGMEIVQVDKAAFAASVESTIKRISETWQPWIWDEVKEFLP